MWKNILIGILLFVTIGNILQIVISHWSMYSSRTYWQRFPQLKQSYLDSQYVNKHPKGWIPDEGALSYAGGALMQGTNPVLIIADTPPLGKYIIGASAIIFDNEHIVGLVFGILSLVLLFLIARQVFSQTILALLIPTLVSFEVIFQNQLIYTPLLDIIQLVFLLAGFYFFNCGLVRKSLLFFTLSSLSLGLFISTKFFITGLIILGAELLVLLFHKDIKKIVYYSLSAPLSVLVLFASYLRIFAFHYTIRALFGIQKYIFFYHKSQLILPFSIWPLLFLNRWYVWFGNEPVISDSQWSISWPIIGAISFLTIILYILRKIQHTIAVEVLMIWTVLYILFFSFGQIASRYLVIYIPILYIVALYGIWQGSIWLYTKKRK